MKKIVLLLATVLLLPACETVKGTYRDISNFGNTSVEVKNADGEVYVIDDMPKGYDYYDNPADKKTSIVFDEMTASSMGQTHMSSDLDRVGNVPSVEVFDATTGQQAGQFSDSPQSLPQYGGGMTASDSSVTIFPMGEQDPIFRQNGAMMPMQGDHFGTSMMMDMGGFSDSQIYFKHGSARLGSGDQQKIASVASRVSQAPGAAVIVEGYASQPTQAGSRSVESSILNLKESMNRSFAVSSTLLKKGVPPQAIKTVSYGSGKASGNESQDRRVDLTVTN